MVNNNVQCTVNDKPLSSNDVNLFYQTSQGILNKL